MTDLDQLPPVSDVIAAELANETFRAALRGWLLDELTDEVRRAGAGGPERGSLEVLREWNRRLADAGWAAPAWPVEHGGRGADLDEQLVYLEEMDAASAPGPVNVIGVSNIAPAIMAYGTPEQQQRFLRPMLRGDEIWSQGMSEPDAGSDLASLRTSAVADGDQFVINGQKTWNSLGSLADWCQLYVRSDPEAAKHKGISTLLVDLRTPGIEIRPVRTITGDQPFAELFFSDVRVPASSLLGPLHGGWTVAMTTLSFERAGVAKLHLGLTRKLDRLLREPAAAVSLADPVIRDRVVRIYSDIACMRWMTNRSLARMRSGQPAGADGSMTKLAWGRAEQRLAELAVDVLGLRGTTGEWATNLAASCQTTIAGGTSEINLNIVGEMGLGLPREPRRTEPGAAEPFDRHHRPIPDRGGPMMTTAAARATGDPLEFDPFSPTFFHDPTDVYRRLRDEAPVYRSEKYGFWALSRWDDVSAAHRDVAGFSSSYGTDLHLLSDPEPIQFKMIIFMDPPEHDRMRSLVSRVFTPRAINQLEPMVRRVIGGFADEIGDAAPFDLVQQWSGPFPVEVISEMLGVPAGDRQQIRHWLDSMLHREEGSVHPSAEAEEAQIESGLYFWNLVQERRKHPADDMISRLIDVAVDRGDGVATRLEDDEIAGFLSLLAGAGAETVTKLVGNAAVLFSRNPEQWQRVLDDPSSVPGAVEEILRYLPPSQYNGRYTLEERTIHGVTIPAHQAVLLIAGSATRDERQFEDPDKFDITRPPNLALGFGYGIHSCLGAALARMESRIALEEMRARWPRFSVDEAGLRRVTMANVAGYSHVPVAVRS